MYVNRSHTEQSEAHPKFGVKYGRYAAEIPALRARRIYAGAPSLIH
jgi:hypothetical protein